MKFKHIEITELSPIVAEKLQARSIDYEAMLREEIAAYMKQFVGQPLTAEIKIGLRDTIIKFLKRHDVLSPEELIGYTFDVVIADDVPRRVEITGELK